MSTEGCCEEILRIVLLLLVSANIVPRSPILSTLMMEAIRSSERRFLLEPHSVASYKWAFFIVTGAKTSYLTRVLISLLLKYTIFNLVRNNLSLQVRRGLDATEICVGYKHAYTTGEAHNKN
jgi:hypothetical protein